MVVKLASQLVESDQFVHVLVKNNNNHWFITFVYASPHSQFRVGLWRDISRLEAIVDGPWALMGDFNATLRDHERQGGSASANRRGDNAFRDCFSKCSLLDIGFQGSPFT
uniref:Endonuclease/exonuclease/phosphatase domain-containing protein n=1 Tax=Cajanus cajan TaxID=3821 RepID=A0A151SC66_CAJCA|nr:hypothetical protein KK1_025709 [Cajanus cajan]